MCGTDSLFLNIPNCKPLREIEITGVDYLGRYHFGRKTKGSEVEIGYIKLKLLRARELSAWR